MMKYLLNCIKKFPKDAFVDDGSYTFRATQAEMDLMDAVIQEGAEYHKGEYKLED